MRGVFRASVPLHLLFRLSVQKVAESRLKILIRYRNPEQKLRRYRKPVQILSGYRKQEYWVPKTGNEHEPSFKYRFQIRNTRTPYSKIRSLDSRIWQYSTNKQTNTMSQQHAPTRFSVNNAVFCTGSRYRTTGTGLDYSVSSRNFKNTLDRPLFFWGFLRVKGISRGSGLLWPRPVACDRACQRCVLRIYLVQPAQ